MAKGKKKEKSRKSRQARINRMAGVGRSKSQYLKYGDYSPDDVHTGTATYRGTPYTDESSTNINLYSRGVAAGGKLKFIFQNALYKITAPGGISFERVAT